MNSTPSPQVDADRVNLWPGLYTSLRVMEI
jgi:hypothetical protein